jgi:hypothetical protein
MATAVAERFHYTPLQRPDSIRILELLPGPSKSPLRCRLIECMPEDGISYEALSYTWNGNVLDHPILLEDANSKGMLQITQNLHDALQAMRKPDQRLRLWADAVCIDQSNMQDKSCQVPQMGQIFRDAVRVVVWLGAGSDMSSKSVELISQIASGPGAPSFRDVIEPSHDDHRHLYKHFASLPW